MIKAIVFDLDGMVYLAEGYFSTYTAKKYGIGKEIISEFFIKEFNDCLIGKADLKQELKPYLKKWNFPLDVDEFLRIWFEYGEFDQEIIDFIYELKKKGIKCILVTNNEKYRIEYYFDNYSFANLFDEVFASYKLGFKKPEKDMIVHVLNALNLKPNEILFCDDKQENLDKAEKFGFKTHKYHYIEEFKKLLENELP